MKTIFFNDIGLRGQTIPQKRRKNDKTGMLTSGRNRIVSIDLLRGTVMVLMALDHVRMYFHYDAFYFEPADLSYTSAALFLTRWITHFCAPVFVFLAGTSAFLAGQKMESKRQLSGWLVKRGVWLIILEVTLVKFAWMFTLDYHVTLLLVIWALGISMIALAAFIHLPKYLTLASGLIMVAGHNLFDNVSAVFLPDILWNILHVSSGKINAAPHLFIVGYPVLSWIGLMILGYCFGKLYLPSFDNKKRIKFLFTAGTGISLLFIFLRMTNFYGDPVLWTVQKSNILTVLSFLNTTKYPPSFLYLCMTIGPSLIFLALFETAKGWLSRKLVIIGRVPLFYYLIHLYVIHFWAAVAVVSTGYKWSDMIVKTVWITKEPQLQGYGFSLGFVYLVWIMVILLLYPLCERYNNYKNKNKHKWWLSYL